MCKTEVEVRTLQAVKGDPVAEVEPSASAWHQQTPSKAPSAPCWQLPASKGYTVRPFSNPKVEEGWGLDIGPLPQALSLSLCQSVSWVGPSHLNAQGLASAVSLLRCVF